VVVGRLFAWEEGMVKECWLLLVNIVLHVNVSDRWRWNLDLTYGYSVYGVYYSLTCHILAELVVNQRMPSKASLFV
jgi:hypothetical protein